MSVIVASSYKATHKYYYHLVYKLYSLSLQYKLSVELHSHYQDSEQLKCLFQAHYYYVLHT